MTLLGDTISVVTGVGIAGVIVWFLAMLAIPPCAMVLRKWADYWKWK